MTTKSTKGGWTVALLAEGVDRNQWTDFTRAVMSVALLAEGVDRNPTDLGAMYAAEESPSSRRAWIEIDLEAAKPVPQIVALLAEGVDRNLFR